MASALKVNPLRTLGQAINLRPSCTTLQCGRSLPGVSYDSVIFRGNQLEQLGPTVAKVQSFEPATENGRNPHKRRKAA